eukprot:3238605-Rhodomonas_salina.1
MKRHEVFGDEEARVARDEEHVQGVKRHVQGAKRHVGSGLSTLQTQIKETAFLAQFVLTMRFLVFDLGLSNLVEATDAPLL